MLGGELDVFGGIKFWGETGVFIGGAAGVHVWAEAGVGIWSVWGELEYLEG